MSNHFYRARWFLMDQIQKLMMGRVRKEAYKGHIIEFITNEDGSCRIYESYEASQQEMTSHMRVSLKNAKTYQEKYIKLGYDKIS